MYVQFVIYIIMKQQDAAVRSQFFFHCRVTLHVSGAFHTHHQEYIKLYLHPPVQAILSLQLPSSNVAKLETILELQFNYYVFNYLSSYTCSGFI